MSIFTEYPVFEPNQVLSYTHLNGLVDYLEEQDRLTRRKLIGIGIACGMQVHWKMGPDMLHISKGVAITSHGYIICLEQRFYDRYQTYTLPEQAMEQNGANDVAQPPYQFFQDVSGNEIEMWELLPTDFVPEEGEETPETLEQPFLDDKVVLVYLECERESLRNCDINDCSDKGAKMTFDVRVLAINENDALAMLQTEEQIAELPVHQHDHPKYNLKYLTIEKINPSRFNLKNFQEIYLRINDIRSKLNATLPAALTDSFGAYEHLLREVYPKADFPAGPFQDINAHFLNVSVDFLQNLFSLQYVYDLLYDMVQGYNEFIRLANQYTAECCPHPGRFPKHVLLGKALSDSTAFLPNPTTSPGAFNPLSAQTGLAPGTTPLAYRHYFIPAMQSCKQDVLLQRVRSVHYRLYLSAYRYDTEIMREGDIRITPSKDGEYTLSDKAVPFYYNYNSGDDFHANWSYDKTVSNRLDRVFSYRFIDNNNHPLMSKMEAHNFYRIEGHIGKGLATVLKNLSAQKRSLGLSFALEPIFIGVTGNDKLDDKAMRDLTAAGQKLFMCKMRALDVIFLILIAILFYLLFILLALLARVGRQSFGLMTTTLSSTATSDVPPNFAGRISGDFISKKIARQESDEVLNKIRKEKGYVKGTVVRELNKTSEEENLSSLYLEINDEQANLSLRDRTQTVLQRKLKDTAKAKEITNELYTTMALVDSSEEVMKSLSAESISKFDFDLFSSRYETFVASYENFIVEEPSERLKKNAQYIEARNYASKNMATLATTETQSLFSNISSEFSQRFLNILAELTLPGYSKKYPGMEHKAGVPKGGTLILLYAHKDFIQKEFINIFDDLKGRFTQPNTNGFTTGFNGSFATGVGFNNNATFEGSDILVNREASDDPLDNFVVLGDFCLPDRCCDSNCDDLYDEEIEVQQGTVTGRVINARTGGIIPQAQVTASHTSTSETTKAPVKSKGQYELKLLPGGYNISASAKGFTTISKTKAVNAGQNVDLSFELIPEGGRVVLIEEIRNGSAGYDTETPLGKEALRYYGSRYTYYDAYALKMEADAASDSEKEAAANVKLAINTITSPATNLTKLNNEIKRANTIMVQLLGKAENEKSKAVIIESIRTVNSAYLDKLSLVSKDKLTVGTKKTLAEVAKTTKKAGVDVTKTVKEWTTGYNLSERPGIVKELAGSKTNRRSTK
ncbi:MAG: hypothetical protein Mars2KO_05320 [Maribacter sp.]